MVRNASRALKIGVHLAFDLNFDVEIGTFYPKKFREAYYIIVLGAEQQLGSFMKDSHSATHSCLSNRKHVSLVRS